MTSDIVRVFTVTIIFRQWDFSSLCFKQKGIHELDDRYQNQVSVIDKLHTVAPCKIIRHILPKSSMRFELGTETYHEKIFLVNHKSPLNCFIDGPNTFYSGSQDWFVGYPANSSPTRFNWTEFLDPRYRIGFNRNQKSFSGPMIMIKTRVVFR